MFMGTADHDGRLVSQSGTFDYILCECHERAIHGYEDYSIEYAREFRLAPGEAQRGSFIREGVDGFALAQFACSVVWRYAVSRRPEAQGVQVGSWEPILRSVTLGHDPDRAPEVMLFALNWPDGIRPAAIALPPSSGRFEGRRVWSFG
jgi:hypothetical protein